MKKKEREYELNNIFEVEGVSTGHVIIKVKADSPLKVAMFPFVSGEYEYITVTRGKKHTLTVVLKSGRTFSFDWGEGGYTLISDGLETLKYQVLRFIEDSNILLEYKGGEKRTATIYYNSWHRKWQLTVNNDVHYWSECAETLEDMIEDCRRFVSSDMWLEETAPTGISVWKAVSPTFSFK